MARPRHAWLLAPLLLQACAAIDLRGDDEKPPVEVLAAAARFPTETSGTVEIRLALDNREDVKVTATSVYWEIWLENHDFSHGIQSLTFEVAPREERVLYLSVPLAFRRLPLRRGPVRVEIGLRGKILALYGDSTDPRGLPFARRMEVLCENAPVFPLPGKIQE
jgi:hypothetical protein